MKKLLTICVLLVMMGLMLSLNKKPTRFQFIFKEKLSEYGFFTGPLSALQPASGIIPYDVNMALFSNYAEKLRFIQLPPDTKMGYDNKQVFTLPVGTVLIKNFYYPADFRHPEKGRNIIETRLLVHLPEGWTAYPYIWNEAQTEAVFEPAGDVRTVSYMDQRGKKIKSTYVIPNVNQCKGCHIRDSLMQPIGIAARHLNGPFSYGSYSSNNQLQTFQTLGLLKGLPENSNAIPANARLQDAQANIASKARAYLDINCGHCHSRSGPASTSGLFLDIYEKDPVALGIRKTPVAAGRGSGNLQFDIDPGHPDRSIIIFRMKTNDPGIAMPELGREQIHQEGIAVISEWIKAMK